MTMLAHWMEVLRVVMKQLVLQMVRRMVAERGWAHQMEQQMAVKIEWGAQMGHWKAAAIGLVMQKAELKPIQERELQMALMKPLVLQRVINLVDLIR